MHGPSAAELLDAWETAVDSTPEAAAVGLLDGIAPGDPGSSAMDLPIGERDRLLLDLRERLFGSRLTAAIACAACGERLELTFAVAEIRAPVPGGEGGAGRRHVSIAPAGGMEIAFRLPTTRDVLAIRSAVDLADARRRLVNRCLAEGEGQLPSLSDVELDALDSALAKADPQAIVELDTTCVSCGTRVESIFDIARHLAAEIDAWARRTLHEVATLAAAYGWREHDILDMSAWRRGYYLQAVGG